MNILTFIAFLTLGIQSKEKSNVYYEQKAFDYFKDSIAPKEAYKNTLYFSKEIKSFHKFPFRWPVCLNSYTIEDLISYNNNGKLKIKFKNTDNIKLDETSTQYPKCFVLQSCEMKNTYRIVSIAIKTRNEYSAFRIEMNSKGTVLAWCKEKIFQHES